MSSLPDLADQDAETVWMVSEEAIVESIHSLSRWDAERWAAGHERRLPPVPMAGLRVALMQLAINNGRDDYLDSAFKRIERAVTRQPWTDHRAVGTEATGAVKETTVAVTQLAQYALAAEVLADLIVGKLPPHRCRQLDLARATVHQDRATTVGAGAGWAAPLTP
jgi:hypothetical protein